MAVNLTLDGNQPQRRWTIALRAIIAIPHWLFAAVLSLVACVVIFFAWFAVLFTARMPKGLGEFLARILHYQARVYAYGQLLLTDRYPPFEIDDVEYPVMLELGEPARFNRAAVLFRFLLQLPALVVTQLVSTGAVVVLFFVWLVTLVAGQMPTSAYLSLSAILRYQLRTWAYMGMLTTDYPSGLFGDRDDETSSIDDLPMPASPRIDRLVLNRGAKLIVVLSLVFGVGWTAVQVATADFDLDFGDSAALVEAADGFDNAYELWESRSSECIGDVRVECQRAANAALSFSIRRYEARLDAIEISRSAFDEYTAVRADLVEISGYLRAAAESSSPEVLLKSRFQVEDAKFLYDADYARLLRAVTFD